MTAAPVYARLALASLVVTVLSGTWLRAGLLWPGVLGGVHYGNAVHAHSHLALFGWATMGMMAFISRATGAEMRRGLRTHAWALGAASALAFLGFLRTGYAAGTIAVSTLHVALWITFVVVSWRSVRGADRALRDWLHVALASLALAGVAAIAPGITMALQAPALVQRAAIEIFLTLLVQGWLFIGAAAVLLSTAAPSRWSAPALVLLVAGTLPGALGRIHGLGGDYTQLAGRAGMLLTAIGSLVVAWIAWPRDERRTTERSRAWIRLAVAGVLVKGGTEALAAIEPSGVLVFIRPAAIAYLHLVLLGVLTSALVARIVPDPHLGRRAAPLHAAGLAVTLGALGLMALPSLLPATGGWIPGRQLHVAALVGGATSAIGLTAVAVSWLLAAVRARASLAVEAALSSTPTAQA